MDLREVRAELACLGLSGGCRAEAHVPLFSVRVVEHGGRRVEVGVVREARDAHAWVQLLDAVERQEVWQDGEVGGERATLVPALTGLEEVRPGRRGGALRARAKPSAIPCLIVDDNGGGAERPGGALEPDGGGLAIYEAGHGDEMGLVLAQRLERGMEGALVIHVRDVIIYGVVIGIALMPHINELREARGAARREGEVDRVVARLLRLASTYVYT